MSNWFRQSAQWAVVLVIAGAVIGLIKVLAWLSLLLMPLALAYLAGIIVVAAVIAGARSYG